MDHDGVLTLPASAVAWAETLLDVPEVRDMQPNECRAKALLIDDPEAPEKPRMHYADQAELLQRRLEQRLAAEGRAYAEVRVLCVSKPDLPGMLVLSVTLCK